MSVERAGEHAAVQVDLRPDALQNWRDRPLGTITENLELELVLRMAGTLDGKRVLDAGCGDGTYAIAAAERGAVVTAVDISPEMLEAARKRAEARGVGFALEREDASSLPYRDDTFDVVLAVTLLCLVPDADAAIGELARVLRPGGRLVLGELGRWSLWAAKRRLLRGAAWHGARFRSKRELTRLATAAGLDVEQVEGAIYYPPIGVAARLMAPLDHLPGQLTTLGAAFIAVVGRKPA